MRKSLLRVAVIVGAFALAATAADDVAGEYTAFGVHPYTRQRYGCEGRITKAGDVYQIEMRFEEGYSFRGVGIIKDNLLCVGRDSDVSFAAAVYEIGADGVLDGVTAHPGIRTTGPERWHRK